MEKMKPLTIGELVIEKPVIQGGMGVGISLSSLAGAVAKAGGVGIISTAQIGFREPDFKEETMGASLVFNPAAGSPALPSASRTYSGRETGRPAPEMMMSAPAFTAVLTYSS